MTKLSPTRVNLQPVSRCCAPTCANSSDNTSGVSFFRFPKDEERCKKWVANCGRIDLQDKPAEKLFANYRLCSAHFQKASFSSTYRNRLVWNAVPTLFNNGDTVVSKSASSKRKPLPRGSQQKFRRFFGFASKRRTSVQLRPSSMVQPMAASPRKPAAENHAAKTVEVVTTEREEEIGEGPRLPVYIEDHMYAVPTVHILRPSMEEGESQKQAAATKVFRLDPENNNRLVMDVTDGEDPAAVKAAMEAVEAALPLLQLSQQPPLQHGVGAGGGTPTITYVTMPASSTPPSVGGFAGMESVPAGTTFTVTVEDPPASELTLYLPPSPNDEDGAEEYDYGDDAFAPSLPRGSLDRNRKGPRLMQDFLLPHLDSGTFGERLQWIDRPKGIFQIGWYHKSAAQWTNDDCVVFLEWDRLKKRPVAHSPQYWMEAKQRFRAALGKVSVAWVPPPGSGQFKNVKLRKIKWGKDIVPPRAWKPRDGKLPTREGRVHRPTISRLERLEALSPATELEEEDEDDADCGVNGGLAVCHRCGYTTRNQRVFLRHRMMHRDMRAFCCRYCPQRFCLPESLFLHLQVHTERYPYTCSSCGVRTRLLLQLWRHELRSLAQRLCFCHRCGLICHIRENLRQHLLKVHDVSVPAAFDTKPFEVCPGFHKAFKVADVKPKAPSSAKRGRPSKKASSPKLVGKVKAGGRLKAERPKADLTPKPKALRPGAVKRKLVDAATNARPIGRPKGLKANVVKPKSPRLLAATKSRLAGGKSSVKRFKGESTGDDTAAEDSKPGPNSLSNRTAKVQLGNVVKLEGAAISDAVSNESGSCDLPESAAHTARKSTPQATHSAIVAYQTPTGELALSASASALAPIEQGRRRTQRMRPPKRKVST